MIAHLKSFPGTPSWRSLERDGLLGCVRRRGALSVPDFPEFDYPLVDRDEPHDPDVALWAEGLKAKKPGLRWDLELSRLRREWLARARRLEAGGEDLERAARLRGAVGAHTDGLRPRGTA